MNQEIFSLWNPKDNSVNKRNEEKKKEKTKEMRKKCNEKYLLYETLNGQILCEYSRGYCMYK